MNDGTDSNKISEFQGEYHDPRKETKKNELPTSNGQNLHDAHDTCTS